MATVPQIKNFLWWDHYTDDPIEDRLERAIAAFRRHRSGCTPNWVWINPRDAGHNCPEWIGDVQVLHTTATLPKHFLLGMDEIEEGAA